MSQKFCNILICASLHHRYHLIKAIQDVEGTIMVGGALTHNALLLSMCDLKAIQMNMQCNLIHKLRLYEFKLGQNIAKAATFVIQR